MPSIFEVGQALDLVALDYNTPRPPGDAFRRIMYQAAHRNVRQIRTMRPRNSHYFAAPRSDLALVEWCERRLGVTSVPGWRFQRLMRTVWERIDTGRSAYYRGTRGTRAPFDGITGGQHKLAERLGVEICSCCGHEEDGARCTCRTCDACGDRVESVCSNCQRCSNCECECFYCDNCGTHSDHGCGDCQRCDGCGCICRDRYTFHGTPTQRFPRYLGVEIECGCVHTQALLRLTRKWGSKMGGDGSINLSNDLELATSPSRGTAFEDQITETCRQLNADDAEVDPSCGLHVHVSAKDLTVAQLLTVARLYSRVEAGLYSIVAPSRRGGHYSAMWGPTFENAMVFDRAPVHTRKDRLDAAIYGSLSAAKEAERDHDKHHSRYHGLNFNALILYGTLEFRLHQGTTNAQKILMWAQLCSTLVEWAVHHDEHEIEQLKGSSFEALCQVVKDRKLRAWVRVRHAHFARMTEQNLGVTPRPPVPTMDAMSEDSES